MSLPIVSLVKSSFLDYAPLISAVVFTPGCNMSCSYCQNHEIAYMNDQLQKNIDIHKSVDCITDDSVYNSIISEEEVLQFLGTRKGLLDGVVISGGEPTIHEGLYDFILQLKHMGFKVKLDTNGTNPDILRQLLIEELVDYVAMDIKATQERYAKISGLCYDSVKESIEILRHFKHHEFRTTITPELSLGEIEKLCEEFKDDRYVLQQYRPHKNSDLIPYLAQTILNIADKYDVHVRGL